MIYYDFDFMIVFILWDIWKLWKNLKVRWMDSKMVPTVRFFPTMLNGSMELIKLWFWFYDSFHIMRYTETMRKFQSEMNGFNMNPTQRVVPAMFTDFDKV